MTEGTDRQDTRTQAQSEAVDRIRRILADGFAFVRGQEKNRSISALSLEEMISREIRSITNDDTDIRPGRLTLLRQLKQSVNDAVDQALRLPAETFTLSDQTAVANTNEEGEGPGASEVESG
jgi:hypothetical protein